MRTEKIVEILEHIPVVNLVPLFVKVANDIPARWDNLPDEKKQALFEALVAAGTKAAVNYAAR